MITSEEAKKSVVKMMNYSSVNYEVGGQVVWDYISQQEKLTTTVKRYFELKSKGITSEEETNEHLRLLKEIKEMVGIEE